MLLKEFDQAVLTHSRHALLFVSEKPWEGLRESLDAMANSLQLRLDNATHRAFPLAVCCRDIRKGGAVPVPLKFKESVMASRHTRILRART